MEKTEIKGFTNETIGIICNKLMKISIEYEKLKIENKALKKQLTLTEVGSGCNVNYKKGFKGLCKCCDGNGWVNND